MRGKRYLDSSSYDKLRKEVDQVLIERHKEALQAECELMLRDDKQQGALPPPPRHSFWPFPAHAPLHHQT